MCVDTCPWPQALIPVADSVAHRKRTFGARTLHSCELVIRDLILLLEADGWSWVRTRGGHRQYRQLVKPGTVTVAGRPGMEVPRGTLASVMKQARIGKWSGR